METHRSRLLTTARPYLQVFSVFGLTPPPLLFSRTMQKRRRWCLMAGYGCFAFGSLLVVIYECYENIVALHQDVHQFHVEDFSKVMGRTQKVLIVAMAFCNQLNILLNYRRLGRIYEDIADLEIEIDNAWMGFSGRRYWWSLRFRLAFAVGLWMVLLVAFIPRFTLRRPGSFNWAYIIPTQIILIILQLKGPEYCLFVLLIYELILRVRHVLDQIHVELKECECRDRIQELCVALKRNQLQVGRIWRLVSEIGSYFTLSMPLLILYNGLTILHVVNWALIRSIDPNDGSQYKRFGASLLLSINLLLACLYSEWCIKAYNSITHTLHKIGCLPTAEKWPMLKMGLREYSLQMEHLKLIFTCGGLFDINLKYFGGMVITILGYIIILVQFKIEVFALFKNSHNISNTTD
ncbi:putative gustatory receptor 98c [Drosophila rhopaloa]|uniref:Gustatory receptor n=1 Tax=Drosophila rhopaloa TaxID=1041015 RepID=A0A6P4F9L4_DRORH|nr:putative gustatory receptor 98c [Drosophila rhopaloa]